MLIADAFPAPSGDQLLTVLLEIAGLAGIALFKLSIVGGLSSEIMPDYLHLSGRGYDIWGRAIKGDIEKLVK